MFTISAKGAYGLTAVVELGMLHSLGAIQIRDIARAHGIPQHYLEQILVTLKKAGLVESYRGSQGGYTLSKPPRDIKVLEVLESLEGELEIVPNGKKNGALSFFWSTLDRQIRDLLTMSIEDLILEKQNAEKGFIYSI